MTCRGELGVALLGRDSVTAVSNIFTSAVRVFAKPGKPFTRAVAEEILAAMSADNGSYWVPVTAALGPDGCWLDVQLGSAKNPGWPEFWELRGDEFDSMWERFSNEGGWPDTITHSLRAESFNILDSRPVRYGFDEVVVVGPRAALPEAPDAADGWTEVGERMWKSTARGSYQGLNERTDMREGPSAWIRESGWEPGGPAVHPFELATPTTPARYSTSVADFEPAWLAPVLADDGTPPHPEVERVDLLWRRRLVHRAQMYPVWWLDEGDDDMPGNEPPEWEHRSADYWDNCLDPQYREYLTGWSERWIAARG